MRPQEVTDFLRCGGMNCDNSCERYPNTIDDCMTVRVHDYVIQLEQRVPRWISVEERLPEANVFAIVYVTNPAGWWDIELDCVDEDGNWTINADSDWHTVTHWMPLPEPPEEGEE